MAKVHADFDECMGYGNCVLGAEDYFDEQNGTVIVLKSEVEDADLPRVQEAIGACPVQVLSLKS